MNSWTDLKSYNQWRKKYKIVLRCPQCNAQHYWTRLDRVHLQKFGKTEIICNCGKHYWIMEHENYLTIREVKKDGK